MAEDPVPEDPHCHVYVCCRRAARTDTECIECVRAGLEEAGITSREEYVRQIDEARAGVLAAKNPHELLAPLQQFVLLQGLFLRYGPYMVT